MGRRQGEDPGLRPGRQDRRLPGQGRAARGRPLGGPALPHVGDPRDRVLAGLAGRARLHRLVRGLRRGGVPVLAGRRLRRAGGGDRQRGDLHRAGRLLGAGLPAAHQVRPRHLRPGPRARRLPGRGRGPAPVPRPGHAAAAERRPQPVLRRRRGRRDARRPRAGARAVHPRRVRGRGRDDAARPEAHARPRPDDVRVVRPRLRPAVPRHRRQQGARRPEAALEAADVQLPPGDRRDDRQGEGLLRRRRAADLPQPGRARPGRSDRRPEAGAGGRSGRDGRPDQGRVPRPRGSRRLGRGRVAARAGT